VDGFPRMFSVGQQFDLPRVADIDSAVDEAIDHSKVARQIRAGQSVVIGVGSRGICHLPRIVAQVVRYCKRLGAIPTIVPAMGSHGGGTALGQQGVLEHLGVTEAAVGCPIHSEIEPATIAHSSLGFPIYFDRLAARADHVIVINRIKPHTGFVGPVESGLMKMLLIGMSKPKGAALYHRAIQNYSFSEIIQGVVSQVLASCRITLGLAIVENAADDTALIEGVLPEAFAVREPALLLKAREWMPRLPFNHVDLLIVDRIGKNISGTGMDTNVIGRKFNDHESRPDEYPKIKTIFARDLTRETGGNASGIGIAEFCRTRIIEKMDPIVTRLNSLTAGHPTAAMIPIDEPTDRKVLDATRSLYGLKEVPQWRWVWIRDTLHLQTIRCSEAFLPEVLASDRLRVLSEPVPLRFDRDGNLPDDDWPTG
jgi:hypothetical protein